MTYSAQLVFDAVASHPLLVILVLYGLYRCIRKGKRL